MCVFLFWQALLISQAASCGHTQPDRAFCQQVRVQSHTDSDRASLMLCYSPSSHVCSLPWALIGILILFAWTQTVFKTAQGLKNSLGGSERESERWHSEGWTGVSYFTLEEWKLNPQGLEGSRELPAWIILVLAWMECTLHVQKTLKQTCICTQTCLTLSPPAFLKKVASHRQHFWWFSTKFDGPQNIFCYENMNILYIKIKNHASAFKRKKLFYSIFMCSCFITTWMQIGFIRNTTFWTKNREKRIFIKVVHFQAKYIQMSYSFINKTFKNK